MTRILIQNLNPSHTDASTDASIVNDFNSLYIGILSKFNPSGLHFK
jgi:hypothetical protein